jgi:hypothetical protein
VGFMDEVSSCGGNKLLKFDGRAGHYSARGSEATFDGEEFVADVYIATGGFLKFKGKGEQPDRRTGLIFPKTRRRRALRSVIWTRASGRSAASVMVLKTPGHR